MQIFPLYRVRLLVIITLFLICRNGRTRMGEVRADHGRPIGLAGFTRSMKMFSIFELYCPLEWTNPLSGRGELPSCFFVRSRRMAVSFLDRFCLETGWCICV
jgi:hypothetical protein